MSVEIIDKPDLSGKRFAFALTEDRVGHYPEFRAFFTRTFDLDRKGLTDPGFVRAPSGLPYALIFIGRSGEPFPSGLKSVQLLRHLSRSTATCWTAISGPSCVG